MLGSNAFIQELYLFVRASSLEINFSCILISLFELNACSPEQLSDMALNVLWSLMPTHESTITQDNNLCLDLSPTSYNYIFSIFSRPSNTITNLTLINLYMCKSNACTHKTFKSFTTYKVKNQQSPHTVATFRWEKFFSSYVGLSFVISTKLNCIISILSRMK